MFTALELRLIGYALAAAALLGGLAWFVHHQREIGAEREIAKQTAQALAAEQEARRESERRTVKIEGVAHDADQAASAARADADAARTADQRLRLRLAAAERRGAASDPSPADPGSPASAPAAVPYLVFDRIDAAAGQLGDYADRLRVSLDACTRSYGALTP